MTGYVVRRAVEARPAGTPVGTRFECQVEAAGFAQVAYYDRPIVATADAAQLQTATPNLPVLNYTMPEDRRRLPLTIELVAPRVVRLRLGPAADARHPAYDYGILVDPEPPGLPLRVEERAGGWTLTGGDLTLRLDADPFGLRVERPDGPPFQLTYRDRNVFGQPITLPLALLSGQDGSGAARAQVGWAVAADERFYGLGERFVRFDQRGRRVAIWNTDAWGTNTDASYKGCPLVCSSAGYAVFAHTAARVEADLAATSSAACTLTVAEEGLDLFLLLGPDLKGVLADYTGLTGRMPMPPRWAFGLWTSRCRYQTRAEVEAVVARLEAEEIPVDVVNLDPAWLRHPALNCDFEWNEAAFPDPAGMVRALGERGVKVCLWEVPYLLEGTALYAEARDRGFLLRSVDGGLVSTIDGAFLGGPARGLVDFTNPEAAAWWRDQHRPLLDMGIAAFKTDFGEGVPPAARSAAGLDGQELRNLYPLLYNRAVWEAVAGARGGEGLVWGRSGWAGSQRYPAQWGGDPAATVDGFAGCLRGGLNWALSAPGAWAHDIGGFYGAPPSPGLYIRWAQSGFLSPLTRIHGTTPREPWHFGPDALRIFRDGARLRYRLLPYLFAVARQAHQEGLPMLRPLVLEFPHDRAAADIDDQYLLGGALLVAPVLSESLNPVDRTVYLPKGEWIDFWTGEDLIGGRFLDLTVPLDRLPLFLRAGRLLPTGPPMRHVDEIPTDPLTLRCAPFGDDALELPEADGSVTRLAISATASARGRHVALTVEGTVSRRYEFRLDAPSPPARATLDGQPIAVRHDRDQTRIDTPPLARGHLWLEW